MVDWHRINAQAPRGRKDVVYENLRAIVTIADVYIGMYTGPGDEEESALSTIYALANAALDEIPATNQQEVN